MTRIDSDALVVRTVELGESDVIATLVTEQLGKVSAVVRGARKGPQRIGGALEPVHTIAVMLDDKGGELATLKEARIVRTRPRVTANLEALGAAGSALRWARHLFPPRTPEPQGWIVLIALLDVLEEGLRSPRKELASAGLALLAAVGYALQVDQCVSCERPCPSGRAACIDPARGGLVCRACGGATTVLSVAEREGLRALAAGQSQSVSETQADLVLKLIDRALAAHTGLEPRRR
ncbi:MAG: DNA repair protein RecO [Myxococcota bacterium]|nr:DNA repair protein RecO [Myxococcota bacterium]